MQKYAIITIKNARFFLKLEKEIERSIDNIPVMFSTTPIKETDFITKHELGGLLYHLTNRKPIPFRYKDYWKQSGQEDEPRMRCDKIENILKDCLIKNDNYFIHYNGNGRWYYHTEFMRMTPNEDKFSYPKITTYLSDGTELTGSFTWQKVRNFLVTQEKELRDDFMNKLSEVVGGSEALEAMKKKYEFADFLLEVSKDKKVKKELEVLFGKYSKIPKSFGFLLDLETAKKKAGSMFSFNKPGLTSYVIHTHYNLCKTSMKNVVYLDATILVPIDNDLEKELLEGPHFGTFGDSGVAEVIGVDYNVDTTDFVQIYN